LDSELRAHPAVRNYTLFCLTALFLLVVCLADRGLGWWCLLPALIGGLALLAHWSLGPPLVILSLTALILSDYRGGRAFWMRNQVPALMDLVLCAAVLAYVLGHYRLLSLMRHVFPADQRQPRGSKSSDPTQRRAADLVGAWEMALLVLALPLWTGISVVIWGWMMEDAPALDLSIETWRSLRVVWVVLAVLAATVAMAGYLRQTMTTPEEALLFLQDQLWRPTRHEQSSLNRWLTWARLRSQRRRKT